MARSHKAKVYKSKGNQVSFKSNISSYFNTLADTIQSDILAQSSYEAAKIFYDAMRANVSIGPTMNLYNSIYHYFDRKYLTAGKGVWHIGPNKKKAPHWHLVEYGHWRVNVVYSDKTGILRPTTTKLKTPKWTPAYPYIRPTYYGNVDRALKASADKFRELVTQAVK